MTIVMLIYFIYSVVICFLYWKIVSKNNINYIVRIINWYSFALLLISSLIFILTMESHPEFDYHISPMIWISSLSIVTMTLLKLFSIIIKTFNRKKIIYVITILPTLTVFFSIVAWEMYIMPRI
jgi:hypothetical protein